GGGLGMVRAVGGGAGFFLGCGPGRWHALAQGRFAAQRGGVGPGALGLGTVGAGEAVQAQDACCGSW
ncbi:hypothetical protein SAMN05421773_1421, partial [Streptomyces aidingensis]